MTAQCLDRGAGTQGIRFDGIGAQLQVSKDWPLLVRIHDSHRLARPALRRQQLEADRSANVAADGENLLPRFVDPDDDVAVIDRAFPLPKPSAAGDPLRRMGV